MRPAAVGNIRDRIKSRSTLVQLGLWTGTIAQVGINLLAVLLVVSVVSGSDSLVPSSPLVWVTICAWLTVGLILGVPKVWARRIAFNMRSFREPTNEEWELVAPAWSAVARRAGVREDDYRLVISSSDECTSSGQIIVVVRESVHKTRTQLEAVIGHELGHALSVSKMTTRAVAWYALPGWWAMVLGGWLYGAALWLFQSTYWSTRRFFARLLPWPLPAVFATMVPLCVGGLALLAALYLGPWLVLMFVTTAFLQWLSRLCDRWADTVAADLGYGPILVDLLSRDLQMSHDESPDWRERVFGATLPTSVRLEMLGRYMANKGL